MRGLVVVFASIVFFYGDAMYASISLESDRYICSVCPKTLENGRRVPISIGKVPVFGRNRGVHLPEVNSGLDEREFSDRHYVRKVRTSGPL